MAAEAVALLQMSCCSSTSSTCATSLVAAWQAGGRAPEEAGQAGRADRGLGQAGLQVLVNKRVGLGR